MIVTIKTKREAIVPLLLESRPKSLLIALTKKKKLICCAEKSDEDDCYIVEKKFKVENVVPPNAPDSLTAVAAPAIVEPPILYTLRPKRRAKNDRAFWAGVPFQVFHEPMNARLEPAPVFAVNGDALHLHFEIASVAAVEASFTENKRAEYEALIVAVMAKTGRRIIDDEN